MDSLFDFVTENLINLLLLNLISTLTLVNFHEESEHYIGHKSPKTHEAVVIVEIEVRGNNM